MSTVLLLCTIQVVEAAVAAAGHRNRLVLLSRRRRRRVMLLHDARWWRESVPRMHPGQFHDQFRMSSAHLDHLSVLLAGGSCEPLFSSGLTIRTALAMLLLRLGNIITCYTISSMFGVSRSYVSDVTSRVAGLLVRRLGRIIQAPHTAEEWKAIARR